MVHYITTMQTHIKSIDDINLNYIFYRTTAANIDEESSDKEHFSALRNVDSLSLLTDKNIKILTAATILSTEIARNNNRPGPTHVLFPACSLGEVHQLRCKDRGGSV
jgi:hypothetical protein